MAQVFSTIALILATTVALGPDDPVGIGDEGDGLVETDVGPREVSIDGARWENLRSIAQFEEPAVKPPGPWAADRQVQIERSTDGVRIRVTWTLEALEAGWWAGSLIGPMTGMRVESVTWRGRDLGVTRTTAGEEVALQMTAKSRGELKLVVFVPADQLPGGVDGTVDVTLMPAVRGELRLAGAAPEGRVAELVVGDGQARRMIDGRFWASEAKLSSSWVDANAATDQSEGPLAVAQSAVGLTFGDGEVRGRARVSWLLRRGQLDSVTLDTAGLGRDLEVVGPNVLEWVRNGDRIDIQLKEPVDGRIDVDLRWTQGLPDGAEARLAAPRITPQQAYRTESFMQIAHDGELEVLPALSGWSAVASAELPEWASGFIQGTATATYHHDGESSGASFELLRFVPLSGPPTMIDVAAYEVATTDEGRSLVHARYDVRNERASHLRLELPNGSRMLGVRVNGETVTPTRDTNSAAQNTQAWRVPLVRSLESVKGSLSFPVEVIFISEADDWKKKESRELQLPAVDAPVAVSRVRVYLPPNYENRVDMFDFHTVPMFSEGEGITYGLGTGTTSAEVGRADELYREALAGWMENDFRRAQSSLDELSQLGASNANIAGLQGNLDLVQGRSESDDGDSGGGQSAVVSRRIKDQANMRAADDKIALHEREREADELEAQGRYDQAQQKLDEAKELGDRLALLEQSESQEQIVYNQALSSKSARVADKKKRKVSRESEATKGGKKADVYDFESDGMQGELLVPEGANVQGPVGSAMAGSSNVQSVEPPPPISEPEPLLVTRFGNESPEPAEISMEEPMSIPAGTETSRDFTAVVDVQASSPVFGRAPPEKQSRGRKGKQKNPETTAAPEQAAQLEPDMPAAPAANPNGALAGPVASASAVSVHIPAIGEAVLYQHMLLPEGKVLTVHLEARRHKPSKRRSK
jgi:tetratricopeptide (TPR) repeat protein